MTRRFIITNEPPPQNSVRSQRYKAVFLEQVKNNPDLPVTEITARLGLVYQKSIAVWLRSDPQFRKAYQKLRYSSKPFENPTEELRKAKQDFIHELAQKDATIASAAIAAGLPKSDAGALNPDDQYMPLLKKWAKADSAFAEQFQILCLERLKDAERRHNLQILNRQFETYQEPIDTLLATEDKKLKREFLAAYRESFFSLSDTCRELNIKKSKVKEWLKWDDFFRQEFEEMYGEKRDLVESSLLKQVKSGSAPATIFAAKCLLKDRGYVEDTNIHHRVEVIRSKEEIDAIVRAAHLSQGVTQLNSPGAKILAQRLLDVTPKPVNQAKE